MSIKELYKLYQQHPCITTDSRDCPQGSIFLALKGESFDGNKFAVQALEKGCAYAIVDDPSLAGSDDKRIIIVNDCLQTFKDLAREHRRQFNIPVIGITGTNGKTTTKELVAAVLSQKYNVLYTQGNFNNDVGVPKTLFRLTKEHEIAVIEMGASHPGDIKTLAETAEPTCGLITNVGRAHLQGFGSFEGVIKTKCELYDFLRTREDGLIFINADNEHLMNQISDDEDNIDNLLAAIAVGINFGVDRKQICAALENYVPSNNRSQMTVTEKNHLIVDAYNANPSSMMAALENFKLMQADNKMAILGAMRELGDVSQEEHQRIVDYLQTTDIKTVWLVGEEFENIHCDYPKFKDVEAVKAAIAAEQPAGHYILIKGSNSTKLFQLPELL